MSVLHNLKTILTILLSVILASSTPDVKGVYNQANTELSNSGSVSRDTIQDVLSAEFGPNSPMLDVAWCESGFKQFESPNRVLRGRITPADIGLFQINAEYHEDYLRVYNVYSVQGNIAYAKKLYERNGLRDWKASKSCWEKRPITAT